MQLVRVNCSQIEKDPTEHIDCVAQATVNIKSAVYNNGTRIFSQSAPIGHPFSIRTIIVIVTNCNTQLSPGPFNYPKDGKRRSWHLLLVKDGHNEVKDDKKRPKSNETHIGYNLRHVPL